MCAIHEWAEHNVGYEGVQQFGDVDDTLETSPDVVENSFYSSYTHCGFLEPQSTLADFNTGTGLLTVYTCNQLPHYLQQTIARTIDHPMEKIRVVIPTVGGAFGGKTEATPSCLVACLLSRKIGRPVKITYTREEVFHQNKGRHPAHMTMKMGFDDRGPHHGGGLRLPARWRRPQQLGLRRDVVHRRADAPALQAARRALPREAGLHEQADARRAALPRAACRCASRSRACSTWGPRSSGSTRYEIRHAQRGREPATRGRRSSRSGTPSSSSASSRWRDDRGSSRSTGSCPTAAASAWPAATTARAARSCCTRASGRTRPPRSAWTPKPGSRSSLARPPSARAR